jgi:hypothetical protein
VGNNLRIRIINVLKEKFFSFSCFLAAGWVFALRSKLFVLRS